MSTPRVVTFRMPPEKIAELDTIAKAMDRDRSYLLNEAVESYLSEQRRFVAMIEEGLEASRKGELVDHEDVEIMFDSWIQKNAAQRRGARGNA